MLNYETYLIPLLYRFRNFFIFDFDSCGVKNMLSSKLSVNFKLMISYFDAIGDRLRDFEPSLGFHQIIFRNCTIFMGH